MKLSSENRFWLAEFQKKHGRPPKILHIGNIANNAYLNAKLLNEAGFDCDNICYDYYHIMGCPEWEDSDIDGDIEDDFYPKWYEVKLNGFKRPKWFAQGQLANCIRYLIAKRSGKPHKDLWEKLRVDNRTLNPNSIPFSYLRVFTHLKRKTFQFATLPPMDAFSAIYLKTRKFIGPYSGTLITFAVMLLWPLMSILNKAIQGLYSQSNKICYNPTSRYHRLILDWHSNFPDRSDTLCQVDIHLDSVSMRMWVSLFSFYDVILAYSTDPFIPLLAGVPYFAFEHGTIREIPFKNDSQGRRTAIAYRLAEHVFVTNFDCLSNAEKLSPGKFTLINHPYDEDHGIGITGVNELRLSLQEQLKSEFLFFFPTRQDWVSGTGYADKANDIFLLALSDLRKKGYRVGAVCCAWGSNVPQSKKLIKKHHLSDYILWVRPLAMMRFERMSLACDVVVDQFKLGAFGGVVFKAMAIGAPILTYLDPNRLLKQYPELPPVINCSSREEIVYQIADLVKSPEKLREIGYKSRQWIKHYHSKNSTVNLQVDQFRQFLSRDDRAR